MDDRHEDLRSFFIFRVLADGGMGVIGWPQLAIALQQNQRGEITSAFGVVFVPGSFRLPALHCMAGHTHARNDDGGTAATVANHHPHI